MIQSKQDYYNYIEADSKSNGIKPNTPPPTKKC